MISNDGLYSFLTFNYCPSNYYYCNENSIYLNHHYLSHKLFLLLHFEHSELKESIFITLGYIVPHN